MTSRAILLKLLCLFLCLQTHLLCGSQELLRPVLKAYQGHNKLGQGSFGVVYEVTTDKSSTAMKVCAFNLDSQHSLLNVKEIAVINALSHPHIIKVKAVKIIEKEKQRFLEMHMPKGERIHGTTAHKDLDLKAVFFETLSALVYTHKLGLAHQDVKPDHMICMNKGTSQQKHLVIDWGNCHLLSTVPTDLRVTTKWYCPPEVLVHKPTDPKRTDMWGLAASLLELARNNPPFYGEDTYEILNVIMGKLGIEGTVKDYTEHTKAEKYGQIKQKKENRIAEMLDKRLQPCEECLIQSMLTLDPNKRATSTEVYSFLQLMRKKLDRNKGHDLAAVPRIPKKGLGIHHRKNNALWMLEAARKYKLPVHVQFEALSIMDQFLSTMSIDVEHLQKHAILALQLAGSFYEIQFSLAKWLQLADTQIDSEDYHQSAAEALEASEWQLIFKHSLRSYQNRVLSEHIDSARKDMTLHLLQLLEIHPDTFDLSNKQKWQIIQNAFGDKRSNIRLKPELQRIFSLYANTAFSKKFLNESLTKLISSYFPPRLQRVYKSKIQEFLKFKKYNELFTFLNQKTCFVKGGMQAKKYEYKRDLSYLSYFFSGIKPVIYSPRPPTRAKKLSSTKHTFRVKTAPSGDSYSSFPPL